MNNSNIPFNTVVTITGAVLITSYILFGGSFSNKNIPPKKTRKKDTIPGLENTGNTCFLNCILQAVSSCSSFLAWLDSDALKTSPILLRSLRRILKVLNNNDDDNSPSPPLPSASPVLSALRTHGWLISSQEQDAHELFHALTSTIDDEVTLLRRERGSLLNVAWLGRGEGKREYEREEREVTKSGREEVESGRMETKSGREERERFRDEEESGRGETELRREKRESLKREKRESAVCKVPHSLLGLSPPPFDPPFESPFKGFLASQLQCKACGFKNAENWSPFESLSLPLPPPSLSSSLSPPQCCLQDLLSAYVSPERVSNVQCQKCSKRTDFSKRLTIGKLPRCLCFHLQRTVWLPDGHPLKRNDFVSIPTFLDVKPFTYNKHVHKYQVLKGGLLGGRSPPCSDQPQTNPEMDSKEMFSNRHVFLQRSGIPSSSLYQLASVVVHVGDALSGHFVTYRRGPPGEGDRWFYTSDLSVREVSVDEVLRVNAYMLFYERLS